MSIDYAGVAAAFLASTNLLLVWAVLANGRGMYKANRRIEQLERQLFDLGSEPEDES